MDEYSLINALYSRVENSLKDKNNVNKLMKDIQKYADKYSDILLSTDFSHRIIFSDNDRAVLYKATEIDEKDVEKAIKASQVIKSTWHTANIPFYILSIIAMRYFAINKMQKELSALSVYMSYMIYTGSHKSSFKYLPNEEIMTYTINNLSNRYLIKRTGTIQGMIEHTITEAISGRYIEELIDGSDMNIKNILSALDTRLSANIKYIATEFYKNYKLGNKIYHEEDSTDGDDKYHIADNISFKINRLSGLVSQSILTSGFDQKSCIQRSCNINAGASFKKLEPILNTIISEDMKSIEPFISDVLTLYLHKGIGNSINDIRSMKFVSEALQIYKSNAQDELTVKIKDKLLYWIDISSIKYGRNFISKSKSSLDTYRRAIYACFIFKIMECAK